MKEKKRNGKRHTKRWFSFVCFHSFQQVCQPINPRSSLISQSTRILLKYIPNCVPALAPARPSTRTGTRDLPALVQVCRPPRAGRCRS